MSNNSTQFQPIKLKSLQEARNEVKSSTNRKFSLTPPDFDGSFGINFKKLMKNDEKTGKISETQQTITEIDETLEKNEEPSGKNRKRLVFHKKKENEKQQVSTRSPSKPSKRQLSGNKEIRGSSRSFSKSKVQSTISTVLDIIEYEKNAKKRLTKEEEKGLISRLQGKTLFKFG
jgi:hypothetical protein